MPRVPDGGPLSTTRDHPCGAYRDKLTTAPCLLLRGAQEASNEYVVKPIVHAVQETILEPASERAKTVVEPTMDGLTWMQESIGSSVSELGSGLASGASAVTTGASVLGTKIAEGAKFFGDMLASGFAGAQPTQTTSRRLVLRPCGPAAVPPASYRALLPHRAPPFPYPRPWRFGAQDGLGWEGADCPREPQAEAGASPASPAAT